MFPALAKLVGAVRWWGCSGSDQCKVHWFEWLLVVLTVVALFIHCHFRYGCDKLLACFLLS